MRTSVGLRRLCLGADDRTIFALAVPALGALAAEPLYVLVDTAIVGHLGVAPLAALALAATLLSGVVNLCNFLAYGSTPMIGRLYAAGRRDEADALGHQTLILAIGLGLVLGGVVAGLAPALVSAIGGRHRVGHLAAMYMRIAAIGLPCALVAVAGQGYLRGIAQLRLPLVILLAGNALNVVLEVVFVYTFHLGIAGSAWATVIAQVLMAAWFVVAMKLDITRDGGLTSRRSGASSRPVVRSSSGPDPCTRRSCSLGQSSRASERRRSPPTRSRSSSGPSSPSCLTRWRSQPRCW
jgi:putative MATE family efflux protein